VVGLFVAQLVLVVLFADRDGVVQGYRTMFGVNDKVTSPRDVPSIGSISELWPHYQARCSIPSWSASYASLHRDIRAGKLPPSYLVSIGVEAGLGDRLSGLLTEFWMSVFLNRALVMPPYADGALPMWEAGFSVGVFDWTFPVQRPELSAPLEFTYRGVRGYPHAKRAYDAANGSMYEMYYLVNNGMSPSRKTMFLTGDLRMRFGGTKPYLFVSSNRGAAYMLFNNSHYHARMRAMGVNSVNLAACTFEAILAPSKATLLAYQGFMNAFTANPAAVRISVNFRAGDFVFAHRRAADKLDPELLFKLEPFFECANQIATWERKARGANLAIVMYFTSESLAVRRYLQLVTRSRFVALLNYLAVPAEPFTFITDHSAEYYHGDCRKLVPGFVSMTREEQQKVCPAQDQNSSIVHAAGQMYVMTQAHHHVFYGASSFGMLSAAFSAQDSSYWIELGLDKQRCSRHDARSAADMASAKGLAGI